MAMLLLRDLPKYETLRCQAERYSGADPTVCALCLTLLRVASDVLEAIEDHLERNGLSQGRFTVLMLLNRDPEVGFAPSDLATRAGVTRATMTGLLAGLEREGLVERGNCKEDKRSFRIKLAKKGRRRLDSMLPDYYERVAGLMAGLNKADRRNLVKLLGNVAEGIPAIRDPGPGAGRRNGDDR